MSFRFYYLIACRDVLKCDTLCKVNRFKHFKTSVRYDCHRNKTFSRDLKFKDLHEFLPFRRTFSSNVNSPPKSKIHDFRRLFALGKPDIFRISGAVVLLIISSFVTLTVPFAIGKIINTIYEENSSQDMANRLKYVSKVLLVVFFIGACANMGRFYFMQTSSQRIIHRMRKNLYSSVINQDVPFFDKNRTGELMNRLSADTQLIGNTVTMNISDGLRSIVQVIGATSMMAYTSPQLTIVSLSIVPPIVAISVLYGKYIKNISKIRQDALANASHIAEEKIGNIRTIKAFANEPYELKLYTNAINKVLSISYKESFASGCFWGFTGLSGNFVILSVFYFGGMMMQTSAITVGDLTSFLLYAAYSGVSLSGLSSFYTTLMQGLGASHRIWELIDNKPNIPSDEGFIPPCISSYDISFEGVKFCYPLRPENTILDNFNLKVPSGKTLAIVGKSGSGKSTLLSLLLRFYNVDGGNIFIGEHDLSSMNPSWVRRNVGVVNQEPLLFSTSIKDNILYGILGSKTQNSSTIQSELEEVCRIANVDKFVECFPEKLDTLVGEKGVMLSGGQKQRIAIARAIMKNPRIIILDEATSALDAESEYLVQEALDRLFINRTCIIIAHRLSTIKKADFIAVLDGGHIVENGSFDELMNIDNGFFKSLVNKQQLTYE